MGTGSGRWLQNVDVSRVGRCLSPFFHKRSPLSAMKIQQRSGVVRVCGVLVVAAALAGTSGKAFGQRSAGRTGAALAVWDTGQSSPQPLAPYTIEQKRDWQPIAGGETAHA